MSEWRLVEHVEPDFAVELPGTPNEQIGPCGGAGSFDLHRAPHAYVVTWTLADPERWLAVQHAAVIGGRDVVQDESVGVAERRIVLRRHGGWLQRIRVLVHGGTGYVVTVSSPDDADPTDPARFLASFVPR